MDSYKSFKPSVLRHAEGMSIDDVYQSAELTREAFREAAISVVRAAGLDPDEVVTHDGEELMLTDELPFTRLCLAPPKGHARAAEKIRDDYDGDASRLVDVNRCSIVVDEEQQLVAVASKLMEGSLSAWNQISGAPRHRRDVVPATAAARWRGVDFSTATDWSAMSLARMRPRSSPPFW